MVRVHDGGLAGPHLGPAPVPTRADRLPRQDRPGAAPAGCPVGAEAQASP